MATIKKLSSPIELFYSYSHKDEALRNDLETHLALLKRTGVITGWHDRKITAGSEWKGQIDEHLNSAKVILLLISSDFLASDYCYDIEAKRALWRHSRGYAKVIPVILRACDWHAAPFSKLQALPTDGVPITSWPNKDEAFTNVTKGIRLALKDLASPPVKETAAKASPTAAQPSKSSSQGAAAKAPATRPNGRVTKPAAGPVNSATVSAKPAAGKQAASAPRDAKPAPVRSQTRQPTTTVTLLPKESVASSVAEAYKNRPKTGNSLVWLQAVWGSLREDSSLKPTQFVDNDFSRSVQRVAHDGKNPLFPFGAPNETSHTMSRFHVVQHHAVRDGRGGYDYIELAIYANGTISVALNVTGLKARDAGDWFTGSSMYIDPNDVAARLQQAWDFAARWWKYRFGSRAASDDTFLYTAGLFDTDHLKFETPPQESRSRVVSLAMRTRPNPVMVYDEPKLVRRAELARPVGEIAENVKMLKMRFDEVDRW